MRHLLNTVILGLALAPAAALACGGLFPDTSSNEGATFAGQAVLIDRRADRVDLHVRLTLAPGAEALAWVLPVAPGATLALGDDAVFTALDELTAPQVTIERKVSGGCSAGDSAGGAPGDRVQVQAAGRLGDYEYAIIASGDAQAAVTWLQDNGFRLPDGAAEALQPYATQGMDLLGVRLARKAAAATEAGAPTPLVVSLADPGSDALPLFPLGLSALSADGPLPVVIYVIGPGRATVQGQQVVTVADVADDLAVRALPSNLDDAFVSPKADYLGLVRYWQSQREGQVWVVEAALEGVPSQGPLAPFARDGAMITRLFAELPPAHITDVRLGWDGREPMSPTQYRSVGDDESCRATGGPGPATWALLAGLLLFGLRRRRPLP
ncbi:MAG: DUF2330 domain-containing protein [Myxococcales bacterium]|nr:DUF2330 domain-containing protein [Myxococcales bacterium]MCB9525901.1 DUF2330 domain-containing protein [Myxococcales bacterium]